MTRAAGGDPTDLDALCEPPNTGRGEDAPTISTTTRRRRRRRSGAAAAAASRATRANRRAGGDSGNGVGGKRGRDDVDAAKDARLGATLLWLHACEVFVADADARVATFASRVARRAASSSKNTSNANRRVSDVSDAAAATTAASPLVGADSPVPDSQPSPGGECDGDDADASEGAWAAGVLRGSLLYRFVADHIPTDAERTKFFEETLDLAGAAASRAAAEAEDFDESRDGSASQSQTTRRRRANVASVRIAPGREDVSPESVSAAAHRLLSRLGDLLDALDAAGADRHPRNCASRSRTRRRGFTGFIVGSPTWTPNARSSRTPRGRPRTICVSFARCFARR